MEYSHIYIFLRIWNIHIFSQEIGPETAEEMTQRIQDLHTMYDRLNEQVQNNAVLELFQIQQ